MHVRIPFSQVFLLRDPIPTLMRGSSADIVACATCLIWHDNASWTGTRRSGYTCVRKAKLAPWPHDEMDVGMIDLQGQEAALPMASSAASWSRASSRGSHRPRVLSRLRTTDAFHSLGFMLNGGSIFARATPRTLRFFQRARTLAHTALLGHRNAQGAIVPLHSPFSLTFEAEGQMVVSHLVASDLYACRFTTKDGRPIRGFEAHAHLKAPLTPAAARRADSGLEASAGWSASRGENGSWGEAAQDMAQDREANGQNLFGRCLGGLTIEILSYALCPRMITRSLLNGPRSSQQALLLHPGGSAKNKLEITQWIRRTGRCEPASASESTRTQQHHRPGPTHRLTSRRPTVPVTPLPEPSALLTDTPRRPQRDRKQNERYYTMTTVKKR